MGMMENRVGCCAGGSKFLSIYPHNDYIVI
jgi:hypothetical protein